MGYDLVVRRPDRQSLGSDKDVRESIAKAFSEIVFAIERRFEEPYWCGSFEGSGFAVQFHFPPGPNVELVELTIRLSKATGWVVES